MVSDIRTSDILLSIRDEVIHLYIHSGESTFPLN